MSKHHVKEDELEDWYFAYPSSSHTKSLCTFCNSEKTDLKTHMLICKHKPVDFKFAEVSKEQPKRSWVIVEGSVSEGSESEEVDPEGLKAEFRDFCKRGNQKVSRKTTEDYLRAFDKFLGDIQCSFTEEGLRKGLTGDVLPDYMECLESVAKRKTLLHAQIVVNDFFVAKFKEEISFFQMKISDKGHLIKKYLKSYDRKFMVENICKDILKVCANEGKDGAMKVRNFIIGEILLLVKSTKFLLDFTLGDYKLGRHPNEDGEFIVQIGDFLLPPKLTTILTNYDLQVRPTLARDGKDEEEVRNGKNFFYVKSQGAQKISVKARASFIESYSGAPLEISFKDVVDIEYKYVEI
jgi:hypothetical protein